MGESRNLPLRMLGIIARSVGTVAGVVLLLLVAFQVCTHTRVLDKIVGKVLAGQVDGDVSFSDVEISLVKRFPLVSLSVEDLLITYPHERYDSLASPLDEGRGEPCDTLLSVAHLMLDADVRAFLDRHDIHTGTLYLDCPRVFMHKYNEEQANWYALKFMRPNPDDSSSFSLGTIDVGDMLVSQPRVVFANAVSDFAMTLDWDSLHAKGKYVPGSDSLGVDADLSVKGLALGDLLSTLGRSLSSDLGKFSTDARVGLDASASGWIVKDSLSALPPFKLSLDVPESKVSWEGRFKDGTLRLFAEGENTEANIKNLTVSDLDLHVDGVDLSGSTKVADLFGRDPVFDVDATGKTVLQKLFRYLPDGVRESVRTSGTVNLALDGRVRRSQMNLKKIANANLNGHVRGYGNVRVALPGSDIDCYMRRPVINLATMKSTVAHKDRALAATATADSIDFDLGESLCVQGRNILIFAQNSSKAINESTVWHPLLGKVTADKLRVHTSDSIYVSAHHTQNKFTVSSWEQHGKDTPYLHLESDNSSLFFKDAATLVAARGASLTASAQVVVRPQNTQSRRRRFFRDSTWTLPDYLSEREFRTSDIRLKVGESIKSLLASWNPSVELNASSGFFATPAFPLRSRFHGLSASLKDDRLVVDSVKIKSGTSDLSASVEVNGLKRNMTRGLGFINVDAKVSSDRININEIMAALERGREQAADMDSVKTAVVDAEQYDLQVAVDSIDTEGKQLDYSLIIVPANVIANLSVDAGRVDYSTLEFSDFHTEASMRERCLSLNETRATTDMGGFSLNGFYSTKTKEDLAVGFGINLHDVTADKVIEMFPDIGEVVPMLQSFKGLLNCEMAATSQIDTNMNFILPSIDGMFKIHGQDLVLEDLGSLKKIAKTLMFKDQMSGRIDDMMINGVVSDNSLEVFPFILAIDRYVVALQGVQSLDKSFDYHASLIKSPILFKLGVNIFGPSFDQWKFRIGRPKYTSTKIPLFNDAVDNMQLNLVTSIKNVFAKGVDKVMQDSKTAQAAIAERKKNLSYDSSDEEILTKEEQYKLESMQIAKEIEEETAALSDEIDRLIAEMM